MQVLGNPVMRSNEGDTKWLDIWPKKLPSEALMVRMTGDSQRKIGGPAATLKNALRNDPSMRLRCTGSLLIRYKTRSFSLAFTLYRYSFGAVQAQNCSSFVAGTKLGLIAGTKLYRITSSNVNAWPIRNTFVSDQKLIYYSVNAA